LCVCGFSVETWFGWAFARKGVEVGSEAFSVLDCAGLRGADAFVDGWFIDADPIAKKFERRSANSCTHVDEKKMVSMILEDFAA
jgi:hypothetical protein